MILVHEINLLQPEININLHIRQHNQFSVITLMVEINNYMIKWVK